MRCRAEENICLPCNVLILVPLIDDDALQTGCMHGGRLEEGQERRERGQLIASKQTETETADALRAV